MSRIEIASVLGFRATQLRSRETRREQASQGGQDRDAHKRNKLANIIGHQSFLSCNQFFNIFILCREPITLFLVQASTHHDVLNVDLLLLHQPITKSLNADSLLFPDASVVDAFGAELRSSCIFRNRHLLHFVDACEAELRNCCVTRSHHLIFS